MSERANVLVVGGGLLGASVALHLARSGVDDVLLVERDDLGIATSNAGAGFVALWGAGHVPYWGTDELVLERYAIDFYRELDEAIPVDYQQNGTIWAAASESGWEDRVAGIARSQEVHTEVVDGHELAALTGIVNGDNVFRAVFQPDGCQISAGKAARALAELAGREGVTIQTRRPVTGIRVADDRVVGVDTPTGPIHADAVVITGGAWTNQILRTIGRWLPMVPLMASRITTGPLGVPPSMPSMIWPEHVGLWVRENHGGLVWGCGYRALPRFAFADGSVPDRFDDVWLDGVEEMREVGRQASRSIPLLAAQSNFSVAHGAPCYTTDVKGFVGPLPGVEGLWVVAGCNEAGVTHGPGYGRAVADLIVDGDTTFANVEALRLDRFDDEFQTPEQLVRYVHEATAALDASRS